MPCQGLTQWLKGSLLQGEGTPQYLWEGTPCQGLGHQLKAALPSQREGAPRYLLSLPCRCLYPLMEVAKIIPPQLRAWWRRACKHSKLHSVSWYGHGLTSDLSNLTSGGRNINNKSNNNDKDDDADDDDNIMTRSITMMLILLLIVRMLVNMMLAVRMMGGALICWT
jgi:hypothetical protein